MLSGNKYTSRSSLGSVIYQCLQQIPKEDYLSAFHDWVNRLQKRVYSKGGGGGGGGGGAGGGGGGGAGGEGGGGNTLKVCNKNMFDKT